MKNNPRRKTPVKQAEVKKLEPLEITGTIEYKIVITDEGYTIESPRNIQNDLAASLIAKDIVERRQVDIKITLENAKGAADKKFLKERKDKLIHTSYGINTIATDILMTLINKASKL